MARSARRRLLGGGGGGGGAREDAADEREETAADADEDDPGDREPPEDNSTTVSLAGSIYDFQTHHGRRYHANTTDRSYWGPNDEFHNDSMDMTHYVIRQTFGGDKLQLAPLPENLNIVLDLGTGTGAWANDFGDQHEEAEVVGLDVSPTQTTNTAPNVRFETDDITQPWHYEENTVSYVHMRYLMGSIQDWPGLFAEAYKALTPGGWVESIELSVTVYADDDSVQPGMAMHQWGPLLADAGTKTGLPMEVVKDTTIITDAARAAGFTDMVVKTFKQPLHTNSDDPEQRKLGAANKIAVKQGLDGYSKLLLCNVMGWTDEEQREFVGKFRREMDSTKGAPYTVLQVVYCRKPEAA